MTPHLTGLLDISAWVLPVIIAITFHEAAHGFVARLFGDSTASMEGRVTLNPIRHVDPIGTVALPALLLLAHSPVVFGYAKPVPVTFANLRPQRWGELCVAAAGPGMNVLLAAACALLLPMAQATPWLAANLFRGVLINCVLAVFNLLPVLPLDGGRVVHALLPSRLRGAWGATGRFGIIIVLILLFLPQLTGIDFIGHVVGGGAEELARRILLVTGNGGNIED